MTTTLKLRMVTIATALALASATSGPGFAQQVGTASAVNPAATVNLRTITIGSSISHMERIRTQSTGSVQVLFVDKTSMTVGPNSDLVINEYVFDPKAGTGSLVATVSKGALRFVGGLISHNGNAEIKTATASIGIRGGVALLNGPNIYIGYGSSTVTSGGVSVPLGAGEFTQTFTDGTPPTTPGPPPPGFVASLLQTFQSAGNQSGGAPSGTASTQKVAAAERRATGSNGTAVAGTLAPTLPPNPPATGELNRSTSNLTQTIQTTVQAAVIPSVIESLRPTVMLSGFLGGLDIIKRPDDTRLPQSTPLLGVTGVALDGANGRVQADFTAVFLNDGQTSTGVRFQFGSLTPATPANSTYVDYDNFSAAAVRANVISVSGQEIPTSGTVTNVSRTTAQQLARDAGLPNLTVCQCDYTRWGFWGVQNLQLTSETIVGTWVAGRPAEISDVPTSGKATYIGQVVANVRGAFPGSNDPGSQGPRLAAGNFSNTVDFGARTGAVSVTNLEQTNYAGTIALLPSDPRTFGGVLAGNVGDRSLALVGSFFRAPTNPVGEMGGSVILNGANYSGSGIFAAAIRR